MLKNLHLQNPSKYISWETLVLQKQKPSKLAEKKPLLVFVILMRTEN